MDKTTGPALFFFVNGDLILHSCSVAEGEDYGDFVNYPHSHFEIWEQNYQTKFNVDFDYFPRGRVVYRKSDDIYLIYYDKCMEPFMEQIIRKYEGVKFSLGYDEHYQCHNCNDDYAF